LLITDPNVILVLFISNDRAEKKKRMK